MPAVKPASRTHLSPAERALRSRLTQIVTGQGFIRGTILERERRCGNPGCRCAKGPGHPGLYLILSEGKGQRQLYIPKEWHDRVRLWVDNHRKIKALIHEISEIHCNSIKDRPR